MPSIYDQDLPRNEANFAPISPLSFIERTAEVYPDRLAIVHGPLRQTWGETYARARRLASALQRAGIGKNDTVAVMLPNTPPMVEAHFGVPMAGAVLNALNTRLDAETIAFMLDHGEAKVVIVDPEFAPTMQKALALRQSTAPLLVIDVQDALFTGEATPIGSATYEAFLAGGDPAFAWQLPADEWDAICLNYTSGTTGNPKGVVYHHRGAAINAISNVLEWDMPKHAVYLWTLPMFHCNGWCFPWTVAARAGVNVCLRRVEAQAIFDAIRNARRHPLLRRAHRARPAGQRTGRDEGRHPRRGQGHGGRGRAAGFDDRGHGGDGLRSDACLRPDRGLRPGHGLRQTRGLGRARHW
jgi:fatty-acyl-CoA synthase